MKRAGNQQAGRIPIIQNFLTKDLDDVFQNLFRMNLVTRNLRHVRKADWRSEKAFETAIETLYRGPGDEVLADMRDECDLRLAIKRRSSIIQLFACKKFRRVNLFAQNRVS